MAEIQVSRKNEGVIVSGVSDLHPESVASSGWRKRHRYFWQPENMGDTNVAVGETKAVAPETGFTALSVQGSPPADDLSHISPRSACVEIASPREQPNKIAEAIGNNPLLLWFAVPATFIWNGGLVFVVVALAHALVHNGKPVPVVLTLLGLIFLLSCVVGGIKLVQVLSHTFPPYLLEVLCLVTLAGVDLYIVLMVDWLTGLVFTLYYCGVLGLTYVLDNRSAKQREGFVSFD